MMPARPPYPAPHKHLRSQPTPDSPPWRPTQMLAQQRERLRLMHYSLLTEESGAEQVKPFTRF